MTALYTAIKIYMTLCIIIHDSNEIKFERFIEAVGIPYYKLSFKLGTCKENVLFSEHKAWPIARMNRIMDIYYKSEINEFTVSSVEIKLVVNNTDCVGFSKTGVGSSEFSATIFFSTNMAVIFYSLWIYTCSRNYNKFISKEEDILPNLPFYVGQRKF